LWIAITWTIKKAVFSRLEKLSQRTQTRIDDLIIGSINFPLNLMLLVWGVMFTVRFLAPTPAPSWVGSVLSGAKVLSIAAGVLFVDLLLVNVVRLYAARVDVIKSSESFLVSLVHLVIWTLGILVTLDSLGVSVTPILASLGIGSLAVALALQPTFENVFSGFQIFLDKPVMPGHYIRLETGEEGFVEKIGWRTSWLRQGTNNTVILPNKQLVNGRILNYNYPSPELVVTIELGVHYNSDLEHVEGAIVEVGQSVMRKEDGGVADWKPIVRFHTLGDSSIDCTAVLRATSFAKVGDVKHAFIKALTKRFAAEKIVIPYPVRALNTSQESPVFPSTTRGL
jgi:small-conductance mechanosensitive channel